MILPNTAESQKVHIVAVASFDADDPDSDLIYFTRYSDSEVPLGATSYKGHLKKLSGTTQSINPGQRKSTISQSSFTLIDLDNDISGLLNTKLTSLKGLRKKRVQYYIGYDDQAWDDYQLVQTQFFHKSIKKKGDRFTFLSKDIQRSTVSKIFVNKKTTLNTTISATATTITVADASELQLVQHDASYNDAPSSSVLYIKIDEEVIRISAISNNDLIVDTNGRGALGTKAAIHEVDPDADTNRKLSVTEFIYLEGSIPKLLWSVLTGQQLNQTQGLPSHWHLNISTDYVNLQDFLNIGNDLWDFSDATIGRFASFEGLEGTSGKKFIEEQLLVQGGLYMPIGADGALKLKRISGVLSTAAGIATLDPSNIVSYTDLNYNTGDIFNKVVIDWGYSHVEEKYIRSNILIDQTSIDTWGETTEPKFLELRGLTGNRHSDEDLARMFAAFRDRYSGPPLEITVTCLPSINYLEVGDVVNLQHPNIRDFLTDAAIDRSFEVQQVLIDWQSGKVAYKLYASSQKATPIAVTEVDNVVSSVAYTSEGTELSTVLTINEVGGVGRIQANGTLSGSTDMTNGNAIYYYDGDLQLDDGFTINVTENVQIRVNGHFQLNGTINGKGLGLTGVAAPASLGAGSYSWANSGGDLSAGQSGYIGTTTPMGGISTATYSNVASRPFAFKGGGTFRTSLTVDQTLASNIATGKVAKIPDDLNLRFDNDAILNVPTDLRGTSGGHGAAVVSTAGSVVIGTTSGGNGGSGGAGLFILAKGMTRGGSGTIDLSGNDGSLGGKRQFSAPNAWNVTYIYAGSGAGAAAGGLVVCIDGGSSAVPSLTSSNISLDHGKTPEPSSSTRQSNPTDFPPDSLSDFSIDTIHGFYLGNPLAAVNTYDAHYLLTHIQSDQGIQVDIPTFTDDATAISTQIFTNTPLTPNADLCSIEVTATDPGTGHYSHSNVYWKVSTQTDWVFAGVADPVFPIENVAANGTVYDIQIRSVSINGNESPSGPETQVTVPNVAALTTDDGTGTSTDPVNVLSVIKVPNVRHLRLAEDDLSGNLTEFTGKHAKFLWSDSSDSEWYEIGDEPITRGAEAGARDQYFSHYQVQVYDVNSGKLVWEDNTVENLYYFTFEHNFNSGYVDTEGLSIRGPFRKFRVDVWRWSRLNTRSAVAASITVSNPAPALPSNLSVSARFSSFSINFTEPTDPDYVGMRVWVSTSSGFTPADTNIGYDGPGNPIKIDSLYDNVKIQSGTLYYVRFAPYDAFGRTDLNVSSEFTVTTEQIEQIDTSGFSNWAFEVDPADAEFILANLASDAVQSEKIINLTAAKLTTGVLLATVEIQSGGLIKATNTGTNYEIRMGFEIDQDISYIFRYGDFSSVSGQSGASDMPFTIDTDGNIRMSGNITIDSGGTEIVLDSVNSQFYINDGQIGNQGIQLQYNAGAPRLYVGNGSDKFLYFDGTDVLVGIETEILSVDAYSNRNIYYTTYFDSLDGWDQSTTGSGSISLETSLGNLKILCGTATGDITLTKVINSFSGSLNWSTKRRLKFRQVTTTTGNLTGDFVSYTGSGDYSSNFIGIKVQKIGTTVSWYAVAVKSGTESAVLFRSDSYTSSPTVQVEVILYPGEKIEVYDGTTLEATVSTNIPVDLTDAEKIFNVRMDQTSVSVTTMFFRINSLKFLQESSVDVAFPD